MSRKLVTEYDGFFIYLDTHDGRFDAVHKTIGETVIGNVPQMSVLKNLLDRLSSSDINPPFKVLKLVSITTGSCVLAYIWKYKQTSVAEVMYTTPSTPAINWTSTNNILPLNKRHDQLYKLTLEIRNLQAKRQTIARDLLPSYNFVRGATNAYLKAQGLKIK